MEIDCGYGMSNSEIQPIQLDVRHDRMLLAMKKVHVLRTGRQANNARSYPLLWKKRAVTVKCHFI